MTKLLTYLSFLFTVNAISQNGLYSVSGRIVDIQDTSKHISALKVRLSFNDSLDIYTDCDYRGSYNIRFSKQLIQKKTLRIFPYQDLRQVDKLFPPADDCPYSYNSSEKYRATRSTTLVLMDSVLNYRADFQLSPMISEPRMPCINFSKNTIDVVDCPDDELSGETWLHCLKHLLQKEPGIIIELEGHSWLENNPQELALRRSNFIKHKLVLQGIDSLRMETLSRGDERPLYDLKYIRKEATKNDMERLNTQNRRVVFKILSFEYDPKLQGKNSESGKSNLNNDE